MHDDGSPDARQPWHDMPVPPIAAMHGSRTALVHLRQPPHRIAEHVSPEHVLCINTGAVTRLESVIGGHRTTGRSHPGDAAFYPAGVPGSFRWHEPADFLQIRFDPRQLERIGDELRPGTDTSFVPRELCRDELVVQFARSIHRTMSTGSPTADRYVETLTDALAMHLVYRYAGPASAPRTRDGPLPKHLLRRVTDHIEAHLGKRIAVAELAAIACCSTAHFSRSFKRRTGLSPHGFRIERRIGRACELLRGTDASIADIALRVGFANQSHFTRHFTRRKGVTPGEFRRRTAGACKHSSGTGDTRSA